MNSKLAKSLRRFSAAVTPLPALMGLRSTAATIAAGCSPTDWVDTAVKLFRLTGTPWYAEALAEARPRYHITLRNRPGSCRAHYRALKARVEAVKAGQPPRCVL